MPLLGPPPGGRGARRPLRTPNGIGTKFRSRILGTLDSLGGGILGILSGDSGGGPSLRNREGVRFPEIPEVGGEFTRA